MLAISCMYRPGYGKREEPEVTVWSTWEADESYGRDGQHCRDSTWKSYSQDVRLQTADGPSCANNKLAVIDGRVIEVLFQSVHHWLDELRP